MTRHIIVPSIAISACILAHPAFADTITMNLDPAGTTSNSTLYGTVLTNGSATWPSFTQDKTASRYRDYQFELQTATGSATFDGFALRMSASLRQNTGTSNSLRATLWAGPIVPNPLLTDSLVTVSTPNSAFTNGSSSYTSLLLSGSSFSPQTITATPSVFFFRVWAEGAGQNNGYQTKMAASLGEFQAVTMTPVPGFDAFIEYDSDNDGLIDDGEGETIPGTRDLIAEVPEPSALTLGAVGVGLAAIAARRARRRLAA